MNRRQPQDTLILMADSRSPIARDRRRAPYYSLAAALNLHYAERHGYAFRFSQFTPISSVNSGSRSLAATVNTADDAPPLEALRWHADALAYALLRQLSPLTVQQPRLQDALGRNYNRIRALLGTAPEEDPWQSSKKTASYCAHPNHEPRAAPWGKLPAIEAALADGYPTVVYIDSDAIFAKPTKTVAQFLAGSKSTTAPVANADLTVLHSVPFKNEEANSGFMVWQNTPSARNLLAHWWHTDAGRFHQDHDYEQSVLKQRLLINSATRARIAIIPEDCFIEHKGQFIRHVASPHSIQRVPRFRSAAASAGFTPKRFAKLMEKLSNEHLHPIDCSAVTFSGQPD